MVKRKELFLLRAYIKEEERGKIFRENISLPRTQHLALLNAC